MVEDLCSLVLYIRAQRRALKDDLDRVESVILRFMDERGVNNLSYQGIVFQRRTRVVRGSPSRRRKWRETLPLGARGQDLGDELWLVYPRASRNRLGTMVRKDETIEEHNARGRNDNTRQTHGPVEQNQTQPDESPQAI